MLGVAAAVLVLLAGIAVGRYWQLESDFTPQATEQAAADGLLSDLNRYLARSNVLLMGFANMEFNQDTERLDFSAQKTASRKLLTEGDALQERLEEAGLSQLSRLVGEVDQHLLLIAESDTEGSRWIEAIKSRIETRDLLYRINLEEMRLRGHRSVPRSPGL